MARMRFPWENRDRPREGRNSGRQEEVDGRPVEGMPAIDLDNSYKSDGIYTNDAAIVQAI